jgi:hypothetical protein
MWRVTVTKHPPLDATLVRAIASALTDTEGGLSNTGIDEVFSVLGQSSPFAWHEALPGFRGPAGIQQRRGVSNIVMAFVAHAMNPARCWSPW